MELYLFLTEYVIYRCLALIFLLLLLVYNSFLLSPFFISFIHLFNTQKLLVLHCTNSFHLHLHSIHLFLLLSYFSSPLRVFAMCPKRFPFINITYLTILIEYQANFSVNVLILLAAAIIDSRNILLKSLLSLSSYRRIMFGADVEYPPSSVISFNVLFC